MTFTIQNGSQSIRIERKSNISIIYFTNFSEMQREKLLKEVSFNIVPSTKIVDGYEVKTTNSEHQDMTLQFMRKVFYR
jgi:hypothetical protein